MMALCLSKVDQQNRPNFFYIITIYCFSYLHN